MEQEQIKTEATNYVLNNLDSRSASPLSGSSESPSPFNTQSNCSSPSLTTADPTDKSSLFRHFQSSSSMSEIKEESKATTAAVVKRHSKKLSKPKKYSQSDVSIESIKSPSGSAHSSISPRSITPSGKHQQYQLHQQLLEQNQHQLQMQAASNTTVSNSSPILNIESIINNMSSNMSQQHAYNYSRMQPQQQSADYASNKYHSNLRLVAAAAAAAAATNPMSQFGFGNQLGSHQPNNALLHHPFPIPAHAYFANVAKYAAAVASNNELMQQQFAMSKSMKQQHDDEEEEDYEDRQLNLDEDEDQINQAREELEEDSILNEPKHQEDNNDSSSTLGIDTSEEYLTNTNANNVANMSGNSSDTSMTAVKTNNQSSSSSSSSMSTSNNGLVCVVCGDISSGKHYGN